MSDVTGHLPFAWQRWFPQALREVFPPSDLTWTVTPEGVLLVPAAGRCPQCHQATLTWKWWENHWICSRCWGASPPLDPKLQWVWEWIENQREHFWPYTPLDTAWGHYPRRGIRPRYHPPQWTDATWQQQLRQWRVMGYLNVQDPPRLTRYIICDPHNTPHGLRVVVFHEAVFPPS